MALDNDERLAELIRVKNQRDALTKRLHELTMTDVAACGSEREVGPPADQLTTQPGRLQDHRDVSDGRQAIRRRVAQLRRMADRLSALEARLPGDMGGDAEFALAELVLAAKV